MARPLGRKSIRSYLAATELERLKINPIEKMVQTLKELDELIEMNVNAYKSGRGLTEKGDAGPAYLANAVRAVNEKKETYIALAKFKYPTLSAVAVKDMSNDDSGKEPMTTSEAIKVIQSDPFAPRKIENAEVVDAITEVRDITILSKGDAND